jgi:1-acyl-sn-glycerol-3-phosphate acyltransferase
LLYSLVKIIARLSIKIYCRHIVINKKELLQHNGPLMLAANHPNSFLDAIILCTLFDKPVYSLARGDAFKNKFFANLLFKLKLLPVYRVSEGTENLEENYKTFERCKNIFKQNGIVLIFSEGRCINEWHLRPLKKGTARLAISSWEDEIDLSVLPVGINYSSFKQFGKNIHLYFGDIINSKTIDYTTSHGNAIRKFNENLQQQLSCFVYEINSSNKEKLREIFYIKQPFFKKMVLYTPAFAGAVVHAPVYYFTKWLTNILIKEEGHYDSKIVGFLFLLYPIYMLLLSIIVYIFMKSWLAFLLPIILPATAWAYVQLKKQTD